MRPHGAKGIGMFEGSKIRVMLFAGAAALALSACGDKKGGAPEGQVVAQVKGEDITIHELNAEIQASGFPPSVTRKQAEQQALQNIVTRRLLMSAAEERKIADNPQFLLQQRRANELMLVQALARDIGQRVPQVPRSDVQKFINDYPDSFAERKFLILDQIQFLRPANIDKLELPTAKTMADVEQRLIANNVEYRRQPASLDALTANPDFIREVMNLVRRNPNEVFMFANQPPGAPAPVMLVNQVREARVIPFTGERAQQFAQNLLQQVRVQNALQQEVQAIRAQNKDAVTYQEGYAPPPPPKAAPGARPSPGQVADRAAAEKGAADTPAQRASQNLQPKE